ncbi:PAC2 family protein [Corynebacterium sp. sy017]|uniref:PAC2 family protein n=1 Tax=unclassified Corynebacterium TaxID=2624378 RepID=UPI0011856C66|nr:MULTISPECIES: PAC2 family protein [unclassified Corynebacterium]MBP3087766.1 PAC2 family protein [Corynebacterium sp. sy017]QDZ42740.1 PAC2 family protein [Corynebacterium sp. sy039]TSD92315.1 PAC2 family protein [Corynebacterium sp. SY003]
MHNYDSSMYELQFPAPEVSRSGEEGPTLIVALEGYADAGQAINESASFLLSALDHRLLASFNNDELIDYRARRPGVVIDNNSVEGIAELHLSINAVKDTSGRSFLLLSGPEPDIRWEAFTAAVASLVEKFQVSQTICLYAAPMTVPHTRPLVVSAHGNSPKLLEKQFSLDASYTVPGSASLMLERLLNKQGRNVAGYTAHVPHYLASSSYPQATLGLLQAVSTATDLDFPLNSLVIDAEQVALSIEEQVSSSSEIQQVVHMLEQQYDEELERYRQRHPHALMPGESALESEVPSGETLGAEFEQFLAALEDFDTTDARDNHQNSQEYIIDAPIVDAETSIDVDLPPTNDAQENTEREE